MELTPHKLRISQSTVNTILSRAQGHYKSILLSAGADETIFKTKKRHLQSPSLIHTSVLLPLYQRNMWNAIRKRKKRRSVF